MSAPQEDPLETLRRRGEDIVNCYRVVADGPHPQDAREWPYYWFQEWGEQVLEAVKAWAGERARVEEVAREMEGDEKVELIEMWSAEGQSLRGREYVAREVLSQRRAWAERLRHKLD